MRHIGLLMVMFLVAVCAVAIYLSTAHHLMMSDPQYAQATYDEESVHTSGAKAFAILLVSLCPLVFAGAALWLATKFDVAAFYPRLQAVKGWQWAAAIGAVVLVWFSIIHRGLPRIEDDLGYIFQARLFAHGMRSLSMDRFASLGKSFFWWWTTGDANLCSFQIPGHSLLLTLGALLGDFSLVSVGQSALTCLATYKAAVLLYGKRVGALTGLLFVTSPFAIGTFSSYCASCSVALCVSLALWAWAKFHQDPRIKWAIALGGALGLVFWMRPTSSLFFGIPVLVDAVVSAYKKRFKPYYIWCSLLCVLLFCAGYVYYCSSLAGHLSLSPGDVYSQRMLSHEISFGNLSEWPRDQWIKMPGVLYSLMSLNIYLHGWPISLLFVILFVTVGRRTRIDWVLLSACLLMLSFYAVKARILQWYYFELFPVLVLISSRSVDELYDQCLTRWRNRPAVSRLFAAVVGAGVLTSICLLTPLTLAKQHLYTDHYNRVHAAVEEKVKGHQALVLLGRTVISPLDKHLLSRNDPFLENNVVYVSLEHPTTDIPALPGFLKNREIFTLEMCQPHQIVVDRYSLHTDTEPTSHE